LPLQLNHPNLTPEVVNFFRDGKGRLATVPSMHWSITIDFVVGPASLTIMPNNIHINIKSKTVRVRPSPDTLMSAQLRSISTHHDNNIKMIDSDGFWQLSSPTAPQLDLLSKVRAMRFATTPLPGYDPIGVADLTLQYTDNPQPVRD
jgi:hypothetical protein